MTTEITNHEEVMVICDGCGEIEQTSHHTSFEAYMEVKRDAGWQARPNPEGGWLHYCKDYK